MTAPQSTPLPISIAAQVTYERKHLDGVLGRDAGHRNADGRQALRDAGNPIALAQGRKPKCDGFIERRSHPLDGVTHALEVLVIHANSDANYQPPLDRVDGLQFVKPLLVRVGLALIAVAVKLGRSLLDVLTEASTEFGEWAIAPIVRHGRRLSREGELDRPQI
jgi:hypothetical protein